MDYEKMYKEALERAKHYTQYTKSEELIGSYNDITEASRNTGISRTSITNCLSGLSKTAGGFIWKKI